MNCPGSVALCESVPSKTSPWAEEGTRAHEVLERLLRTDLGGNDGADVEETGAYLRTVPREMFEHGGRAARFILDLAEKQRFAEVLVESRIYLKFIHPEMFGTFDAAIVDHFGTLHVFDYKYGVGGVSPVKNLQEMFYAIGLAHDYGWNFKRARLWIIQPRIKGYEGPIYWDVPMFDLKTRWVPLYREGVERVEKYPKKYAEGSWCHFCNAKGVCPLKKESKNRQAALVFGGKFV